VNSPWLEKFEQDESFKPQMKAKRQIVIGVDDLTGMWELKKREKD